MSLPLPRKFHVDALLLAGAQEHVEDALALIKGDLDGL